MDRGLLFLRPRIESQLIRTPKVAAAHLRFFSIARARLSERKNVPQDLISDQSGARERFEQVRIQHENLWPRLQANGNRTTCRDFVELHQSLTEKNAKAESQRTIQGRISSIRTAGSKLVFIDIVQDRVTVQLVGNLRDLKGVDNGKFRSFIKSFKRGDLIQAQGNPGRSSSGELSLFLSSLPELVSPCLPPLPEDLGDQETRMRNRHVDMLVNPKVSDILRLRSTITQSIRQFLLEDGQLEVQTPILAAGAGGATARPFQTRATEFQERGLSLRIAPELWLKRLIIGGFDRVFEIGPSFRNEGIDPSHNPEFATCEFYRSFTDLEQLMSLTERMLENAAEHTRKAIEKAGIQYELPAINFKGPYPRLDFILELETSIGHKLPDLSRPQAADDLLNAISSLSISPPERTSLPHLLDFLCAHFIEPKCDQPTFIINIPECLSPLAKSFMHPANGQRVTARAELFVKRKELVNTYEEENSPIEQRRKFMDQLELQENSSSSQIDESYLEALEWGLPPTGGWGGGIERICMTILGVDRISDVLSFGSLRNVVALGSK